MHSVTKTCVNTYAGERFYPLAPLPGSVSIESIAHALAHQCRFNGHCARFYSVAEHSICVSYQVPPALALAGLLHDAAEAYIGDVVRPIKSLLCLELDVQCHMTFRAVEQRILRAIFMRFDVLPTPTTRCRHDDWLAIDDADLRMLATERGQLFDERQPPWGDLAGVVPCGITLECLDPLSAKLRFLKRFHELTELR